MRGRGCRGSVGGGFDSEFEGVECRVGENKQGGDLQPAQSEIEPCGFDLGLGNPNPSAGCAWSVWGGAYVVAKVVEGGVQMHRWGQAFGSAKLKPSWEVSILVWAGRIQVQDMLHIYVVESTSFLRRWACTIVLRLGKPVEIDNQSINGGKMKKGTRHT
jgi:hypothetical protein